MTGGGQFTNEQLSSGVVDPLALDDVEKAAWECLSHWADDNDVRAKDAKYAAYQQEQVASALADLEALDAGYLPTEVAWGEHQATRIPFWALLIVLAAIVTGVWIWVG